MFRQKIRQQLQKLKHVEVNPLHDFEKKSYSQSGEDLLVDYIFKLRRVICPTFLDFGANHPYSFNNTFLFYQRGSRGVNIEANPELIKYFEQKRPGDKNINLGVANQSGRMTFYINQDAGLSTFSKAEADKHEKEGRSIIATIPVDVETPQYIIQHYCDGIYPDLVSIDVEGFDEEIVKAMNFSASKPKVICLETVEFTLDGSGKKRTGLIELVKEAGFTVYADTNINTIFVEDRFWFNELK